MNNNNVEIIKPTLKTICIKQNREIKLIHACAYCRVSTDNEDQKTSYESQRIHYKNMIEENPNYENQAQEEVTNTEEEPKKPDESQNDENAENFAYPKREPMFRITQFPRKPKT